MALDYDADIPYDTPLYTYDGLSAIMRGARIVVSAILKDTFSANAIIDDNISIKSLLT